MRSLTLLAFLALLVACPSPLAPRTPDAGEPPAGEGEGEGSPAGEGEGEGSPAGEGEGEGSPAGEGEGEPGCGDAAPEERGAFAIETQSAELEIGARTVALTVVLPVAAGAGPVVVLHPGFQLHGSDYQSYAEHLASRGVASVLLDPPFALFGGPSHAELAEAVSAALDWLEEAGGAGGALAGRFDASRVVLAGHSLGGKIALLAATRDPRPLGVFAIDPVDAAGGPMSTPSAANPSVTPELMPLVEVPVAVVGELVNASCTGAFCQACAPEAENFQRYYEAAEGPAWLAEVIGANHMSFLDDPACGFTCSACDEGSDDPSETRRLTRRWLTAFVALLDGDPCARAWLSGAAMDAELARGAAHSETKNGF